MNINLTSGGQTTHCPGKIFIRCFVFLTTTFSQSLSEFWGVAIFCCWHWLTSQGQTTRCFVKSFYTLTVRFICNYISRSEWILKWRNFPDISPIGSHVIWISFWPLQVKRLSAREKYFSPYFDRDFVRNLRGRDFLLLTLADWNARSKYSMLGKILLHVDCRFHMQIYPKVGVNSEVM